MVVITAVMVLVMATAQLFSFSSSLGTSMRRGVLNFTRVVTAMTTHVMAKGSV